MTKILLVDDDKNLLSMARVQLERHYEVITALSGEDALGMLNEGLTPGIVLLDIDMPGMNGYELAYTVRQSANHAKTPIVFLTGNSSREHVINAMQAGGNDFVVKPVNQELLLTKVGKYLA